MSAEARFRGLRARLSGLPARLLADLFLHQRDSARSALSAGLYATLVVLAVLPLGSSLFTSRFALLDGHARISLDMAFSRVFCSEPRHRSQMEYLAGVGEPDSDRLMSPISTLVSQTAPSLEEHCGSLRPLINNEASLMWLMAAVLTLDRDASLFALGVGMLYFKLALLWFFVFALLRSGASVVLSFLLSWLSVSILHRISLAFHHYSVYSFFFLLVLLVAGFLCLSYVYRWYERSAAAIVSFTLLGLLIGFAINIRTSYLPVLAAQLCLFLLLIYPRLRKARSPGRALRACFLFALCTFGGWAVFHLTFIRSIGQQGTEPGSSAYQHHVVAHPLVLSLAIPPNPLAKREGIAWNDVVGLTLARRVDPTVEYLGTGYDEALMGYYYGLWRRFPREMLDIYKSKLLIAGHHLLYSEKRDLLARMATPPVSDFEAWNEPWIRSLWLPNGALLLAIFIAVTVGAALRHLKTGLAFPLLLALLGSSAVLLLLESAIIMPHYYVSYHNYSLLWVALLGLLVLQMAVNGLYRLAGWGWHSGRTLVRRSG